MKRIATLPLILALSTSGIALAQSASMQGMDMKEMGMRGMEMGKKAQGTAAKGLTHKATGVVKEVDPSKGTVTLAHGPVKSLKWPAMTMRFVVKDKMLFDKLAVDKKVKVEFMKQDADYIVTAVR